MSFLKNLRLQFSGDLHEIYLINFSVEAAELRGLLPEPIRPSIKDGRAMISMVDVRLLNMRAKSKLIPFKFHYQHIGFRVLVEDAQWNPENSNKGIYFLRSFTDNPTMTWAGNMFANYRLENAKLINSPSGLRLTSGDQFLEYHLTGPVFEPDHKSKQLKETIGAIDRAWAVEDHELQKTQIMREKWPLQAMNCLRFETNFFETARFEGAFRVTEMIHYTWLPAETVAILTPQTAPIALAMPYA